VGSGSPAPVTVFTFFLELPHALPMSASYVTVSGDRRDEHWEGWSDDDVAQLLDPASGNPFPPGFAPVTATAVRQVEMNDVPPLLVAEEAFADWVDDLIPESAEERAIEREEWADSGVPVVKTVVALSRFVPRSAHPSGHEMTVGWLHSQFQQALDDFNGLLEALGFVVGRWEVGPLALRDLPAQIPVLIGTTERLPGAKPSGVSFTAQIHEALPALSGEFADEQRWTEEAIELNNRARNDEQPYMLVFRFVHVAESERLAGNGTRAVIDLNTAVEILVGVTLYVGGSILDLPEEEVEKAFRAGVKGKVQKHLAALLGEEIDIDDPNTPWGRWFSDGYMLRNQAVHEGASLEPDAVGRAFMQAGAVFVEVKRSLEAIEPLRGLGRALELTMSGEESVPADEPLGVSFPWD
jgi:hypothetical protein